MRVGTGGREARGGHAEAQPPASSEARRGNENRERKDDAVPILLLLARLGEGSRPQSVIPKLSQETPPCFTTDVNGRTGSNCAGGGRRRKNGQRRPTDSGTALDGSALVLLPVVRLPVTPGESGGSVAYAV